MDRYKLGLNLFAPPGVERKRPHRSAMKKRSPFVRYALDVARCLPDPWNLYFPCAHIPKGRLRRQRRLTCCCAGVVPKPQCANSLSAGRAVSEADQLGAPKIGPSPGRVGRKLGRKRSSDAAGPKLSKCWAGATLGGQTWPGIGRRWPDLDCSAAELDRFRPELARNRPSWARSGATPTDLAPSLTTAG